MERAGENAAAALNQHEDVGAAVRAGAQALGRDLATIGRAPGVTVDHALLGAYAAAAAPNSLRAFRADVTAFDAWCHARGSRCLPASPQLAAGFLSARASEGAAPASLTRYRASIAKLHRLCRMPDPCSDELVKLTLAAHRRVVGVAQKQARPLRFKGAVRDPLADAPRGVNVRAALDAWGDTLTGLRDRTLLSVAYDTGLRTSELVAIVVQDIVEALDPDARLLKSRARLATRKARGPPLISARAVSARSPGGWTRPAFRKARCFAG